MKRDSEGFRTSLAALVATIGLMAPFLTGALAVSISDDLHFGGVVLGVAVASFYLSSAVFVVPLGRVVDSMGATRSLRIGLGGVAVSSAAVATVASGPVGLIVALAACGASNGLVQPAANRLLIRSVGIARLGLAFGVKQSAPPAASMVAGMAVPLIAAWDWRAGFGVLAFLALLPIAFLPKPQLRSSRDQVAAEERNLPYPELLRFAVALGLGSAASGGVTTFFVELSTAHGFSESRAGVWLGVASASALVTRVLLGSLVDRRRLAHFRLCGWMLLGGSVGIAAVATLEPSGLSVGLPLALAGTWGFNGVFWYAVMSRYGAAPGGATGVIFPGGLLGAVVGPVGFGVLADTFDYRAALFGSIVAALLGGWAMFTTDRRLRQTRAG